MRIKSHPVIQCILFKKFIYLAGWATVVVSDFEGVA